MEKKTIKHRKIFEYYNKDFAGTIRTFFIIYSDKLDIYQEVEDLDGHKWQECIRLAPGDYKPFLEGLDLAYKTILNSVHNGTN